MLEVHARDDARRGRMLDLIDALATQGRALELLHEAIDKHRDVDGDSWASIACNQAAEALEESLASTLSTVNSEWWERSLVDIAQDDDEALGQC